MRFVALALVLAGCPAVNVEQVDVHADNPEVNVGDVGSHNSVDVNVDATEQPDEPVMAEPVMPEVEVKRVDREPAKVELSEPKPEPAPEPEPCDDHDSDGVCDEADTCPAGSDADADGTGYADGCERALWSTAVWVSPSPHQLADSYEAGQPSAIAIEPNRGHDCLTEAEGDGMLAIELPQHHGDEPLVIRVARPESGRGSKMVDCLEAGVVSTVTGGLSKWGSIASYFTETRALPEGSVDKHIVYFEVVLDEYVTLPAQPYGTLVTAFNATITARGY
jgi:hypothetical protein